MVLDLVIIGLVITLSPLTLVAFILLLAAKGGIWKGLAFILGWMACLVAVIAAVLLTTGGNPPRQHTAPSAAVLVVKALLGILLIWIGIRRRRRRGLPRKPPTWMGWLDRMSPWAAVGFGAFMQPWSLVAIGAATVVQAKLSTVGDWLALVVFCLLATSSFLVMELYAVLSPEAAAARLGRIRTWIDGHMDQAIILVSLALGGLLLADSIFLLLT
ncbi:MAG TPA: GAP family protein [Streptosporangiaceae bacterium]